MSAVDISRVRFGKTLASLDCNSLDGRGSARIAEQQSAQPGSVTGAVAATIIVDVTGAHNPLL
jgi:hypothetical protein